MVPTTAMVLVSIFPATLCHPVDKSQEPNMMKQDSLMPDHTGSIFGGLELDEEDYADYDYQEPSSSSFLTDLPLPAGPTRRPDQAVSLPLRNHNTDSSSLSQQLAKLPFLTTKRPTSVHRTTRQPRTHFGLLSSSNGKIGSLLVHSSMDIVDQTRLFSKMDPFQEQFIAPPSVNAGALPLSVHFGQSLFPPFNNGENDADDFEKL
eukprot:TRINITY_DN7944_c0_g1_i3.p1 TRINITY_DN7944_c0_g1~~TRINITY_DN7944_c0_g1_i3.p1  ORF type:complete len:205 (+),score=50.73 TRINITY_DN7944_c0_g1_i3:163-777(+)